SAGRVVGFSGRILKKDADAAKYLNSPDTPLFNKSEILYGFDKAKNAIKKLNYSILVEGQMDLLMSHQAGIVNTVASSGTALTAKHLMMLKRLSNRVMMAFDPDTAGMKAAMRAWKLGLATGMEVKIAQLPEGYDPADLILKKKEQWLNVLKDSKHIIDFLLSKIKLEIKDKRQMALAVRDQVLPFIALINSDIEKAHYIKIVSQEIDFREEAIWEDLKKIPKERIEDLESDAGLALHRVSTIDKNILRRDGIEKRVCGLVMWQESKKEPVIDIGKVKERLISIIGEEHWKIYSDASDSDKSDIIFQAEVFFDGHNHLPREMEILLMELEMEVINKESDLIMRKLSQSEKGGEISTEEDKLKLLDKFNSLSRKKQQLKENQQKL
ncbi:MAG: toprim domain-containing protein, partial [bacterium]